MLICVTGMDGTGKTTLSHALVERMRARGYPAVYRYGRIYPLLSRALMAAGRTLLLHRHDPWQDYPAYAAQKRRVMRSRCLAEGYRAAILADYYVQMWAKVALPRLRRCVIVCDRYVYDTVISDLAAHLAYTEAQVLDAVARCLRRVPAPALTLLIDLDEETAFARKTDVPHPDYLHERRKHYRTLVARPEVTMVNGALPVERLVTSVMSLCIPMLEKERAYACPTRGH